MKKSILTILVLSGLFVVSVVILLLFFSNASQGTLGFEVAKALLQLCFVSVIGTFVSILVFEYQQEHHALVRAADVKRQELEKERDSNRKRLEYRETLLLSTLSRVMENYGQSKKIRRILRGIMISTPGQGRAVMASQYDTFFDSINDAQLDLENLARDVETSAKAFSAPNELVSHLRSMDSYLGKLIGEYEEMRHRFEGKEPSFPLRELKLLEDYLKPSNESKFKQYMVEPYHEVQKGIRADLLHPNLPEL